MKTFLTAILLTTLVTPAMAAHCHDYCASYNDGMCIDRRAKCNVSTEQLAIEEFDAEEAYHVADKASNKADDDKLPVAERKKLFIAQQLAKEKFEAARSDLWKKVGP